MKRILVFATVALLSGIWSGTFAQEIDEEPERQGTTLPAYVAQISEMEEIGPGEYLNLASGTAQLGHQMRASGQQLPPSVVHDALDAVEAGRTLDSNYADWDTMAETLNMLLEQPEQQPQDQQSDSQDGESDEQQAGESGENGSEESGEQSQEEQSESEENQQGSEGEEQQSGEEGQQSESEDSQSQSGEQEGEEESEQLPQAQDGAQMGDLQQQDPQDIQLDGDESEANEEEMQTLGGQQGDGQVIQAENAALMQMLEQLKQQDDPGKLYQILQEAQSGNQQNSQPSAKDW